MSYHRQCVLVKPNGKSSNKTIISWIPEEYAVINKYVKLKNDGIWEDGWKVTEVGSRKLSKDINERSRDYLRQRKVSDI